MGSITIKKGPDNTHSTGECDNIAKCVCQGEMKLAWEVGCTYVVAGTIPDNPIPQAKRGSGMLAQKQALVYVKMESTTVHKVYDAANSLVKTITVNSAPEYHLVKRSSGTTERDCHVSWVEFVPLLKCKLVSVETITLSLWSPVLPAAGAPFTPEPPVPVYRQGTGTRTTTDANGQRVPEESGNTSTDLPELPGMASWAQFSGFSGSGTIEKEPEHCGLVFFHVIDYVGGFPLAMYVRVQRESVATALAAIGRQVASGGGRAIASVGLGAGMLAVGGDAQAAMAPVEEGVAVPVAAHSGAAVEVGTVGSSSEVEGPMTASGER